MERMKDLRDTLAHGKPVEIKEDGEKEGTEHELRTAPGLAAEWEDEVKPEIVSERLEDLDTLWKLMITKSGVPVWDTLT
jgi:hypothetical protein